MPNEPQTNKAPPPKGTAPCPNQPNASNADTSSPTGAAAAAHASANPKATKTSATTTTPRAAPHPALNQRVATVTSAGTQQFLFTPDGKRAATLDGSGTPVSAQAYFAGAPLAFYKSGAFHFQHQDWLGTERLRTSQTGTAEGTFSSLSFGDAYSAPSGDTDPSHYTGLDQDTETGNSHAMFRDYNPGTGTWMRPDPYFGSYDTSNPQSMNRYAYVLNQSLSLTDPSGLDFWIGNCYYHQTATSSTVKTTDGTVISGSDETDGAVMVGCVPQGGGNGPGGGGGPGGAGGHGNQNRNCFIKGVVTSVVTGLVVDGAAIDASELGVPPEITGPALFVLGVAGGVSLGVDIVQNFRSGNTAGLYYDAGSVAAGLLTGGILGGKVAKSIDSGATSGWSLSKDWGNRFRPSLGLEPGPWLAPDKAGARGATAAASGLGSLFTGCGG